MEPRSFNRGDGMNQLAPPVWLVWLQWSHGRLTVVTGTCRGGPLRREELQWSHGRLTVVTQKRELFRDAETGFNGATVV